MTSRIENGRIKKWRQFSIWPVLRSMKTHEAQTNIRFHLISISMQNVECTLIAVVQFFFRSFFTFNDAHNVNGNVRHRIKFMWIDDDEMKKKGFLSICHLRLLSHRLIGCIYKNAHISCARVSVYKSLAHSERWHNTQIGLKQRSCIEWPLHLLWLHWNCAFLPCYPFLLENQHHSTMANCDRNLALLTLFDITVNFSMPYVCHCWERGAIIKKKRGNIAFGR